MASMPRPVPALTTVNDPSTFMMDFDADLLPDERASLMQDLQTALQQTASLAPPLFVF
jgi:hypothetical protein